MADERDEEPEGWGVPFRIGAISGIAVPVVLGLAVLAAGAVYDHTLRPKVAFTVTPQPAPGLEADIHAGTMDPEVAPPLARPDPRIERAKAEVAAHGIAGWNRQ